MPEEELLDDWPENNFPIEAQHLFTQEPCDPDELNLETLEPYSPEEYKKLLRFRYFPGENKKSKLLCYTPENIYKTFKNNTHHNVQDPLIRIPFSATASQYVWRNYCKNLDKYLDEKQYQSECLHDKISEQRKRISANDEFLNQLAMENTNNVENELKIAPPQIERETEWETVQDELPITDQEIKQQQQYSDYSDDVLHPVNTHSIDHDHDHDFESFRSPNDISTFRNPFGDLTEREINAYYDLLETSRN